MSQVNNHQIEQNLRLDTRQNQIVYTKACIDRYLT